MKFTIRIAAMLCGLTLAACRVEKKPEILSSQAHTRPKCKPCEGKGILCVDKVTIERLPPNDSGWVARAYIEGEGMIARAAPIMVKFGDTHSEAGGGDLADWGSRRRTRLTAAFKEIPKDGSLLSVGYLDTGFLETCFEWK